MKMERTKFFGRISEQLDGTNILNGLNYNANLDTGIQNMTKNLSRIHVVNIIYCPILYFRTG